MNYFHFKILIAGMVALSFSNCVRVEPIEVKPIEINLNVRVTVEKELNDFFGDLDKKEQAITN